MTQQRRTLTVLALAFALAACAPRTQTPKIPVRPPQTTPEPERPSGNKLVLTDPAALDVDRSAREAFHLMGLEYARTGAYSVNVLVSDLELPSGARWALENITPETYALRFTSDNVPEVAWFVSPEGVKARQVDAKQIY